MYSDPSKIIAITCAFGDTSSLLKVLTLFPSNIVGEICVVIDCASDVEIEVLQRAVSEMNTSVHVISNNERKGVGYAIRESINYGISHGYEIAVLFAANMKDNPGEIPRLLSPILSEGCDYVQGSRFLPGGKAVRNPFLRGIFSRLYPFAWTILTGVKCTDVTNGFRAYRLKIFSDKRIHINNSWLDSYEFEYYLHFKVLTLGYNFREVPVSKTYPYRHKGGYSRISPIRDWWKIIKPLVLLKLGIKN